MKIKMIATWKMSFEALTKIAKRFDDIGIDQAIIEAIKIVEDNPQFTSVAYGGLPNIQGEVEVDAAFMCGNTLKMGAIAGAKNIANPIELAYQLKDERFNNMLVGAGAEKYAQYNGFAMKNLLTSNAKSEYQKRMQEIKGDELKAYDGHDTVCMLGIDNTKKISVGVSTSGLYLKHPGRVGDSPIIGSGFYADSNVGAAAATGVGEEIMRGCLSIKAVDYMQCGLEPMAACEKVLREFEEKLISRGQKPRAISIIAIDQNANAGVATNTDFPFIILDEQNRVQIYLAKDINGETVISKQEL